MRRSSKELEDRPHVRYTITNILNGKKYTGITCNEKTRWSAHKTTARRLGAGWAVHQAMRNYGIENFLFEVVERFAKRSLASEAERIAVETGEYTYNEAPGGDTGGCIRQHTDETKAKISESKRGKPRGPMPQYHKDAIAAGNRGKKMPPRTEEQRKAISEAKKGEVRSEEFKKNLSAFWTGKPKSPESIEKTRQANLGLKRSEETKQKLRDAWTKRKARQASPVPRDLSNTE